MRAGSQGDKNAPPVCRQSDGVRNSDRKTGWIPPSPSAVRGRERAHNAMSRSLLIPRSRAAAAARGGRAPGQRPRPGGEAGVGPRVREAGRVPRPRPPLPAVATGRHLEGEPRPQPAIQKAAFRRALRPGVRAPLPRAAPPLPPLRGRVPGEISADERLATGPQADRPVGDPPVAGDRARDFCLTHRGGSQILDRHLGGVGGSPARCLHPLRDGLDVGAALLQPHLALGQGDPPSLDERQAPQGASEDQAVEPGPRADPTVGVLRGQTAGALWAGVLLFGCWLSPHTARQGNA